MQQVNETLFDQDKNENLLQWNIFTDYDEVVIIRGRVGMKQTESRTTSKPKNIGKKNETTGYTQALADAESKWKKQIKKGYTPDKSLVGTTVTLAPLAKKYQDVVKNVDWSLGQIVPTKYDGVRNTVFYRNGAVFFQSRGGEAYPVIEKIADELYRAVFQCNPTLVVDGELYCHGMHLEDITACVKKHNEDTHKIQFVVFDIFYPHLPEVGYKSRIEVAQYFLKGSPNVVVCDYEILYTEQGMKNLHDILVRQGYEGVIIRHPAGKFLFNQRDISFIKYKLRHRAEYKTIAPIECKNGSVKIRCKVVVDGEVKFFEPQC